MIAVTIDDDATRPIPGLATEWIEAVPSHPFDDLSRAEVLALARFVTRTLEGYIWTLGHHDAPRAFKGPWVNEASQALADTAWGH